MSATMNGRTAMLERERDTTAARCLAILEKGIAKMLAQENPATRLVAERRALTKHPDAPWRNLPGVTYPDQRKRGPKPVRQAVNPERRQAILDLYLARRSITYVASALHCGVHIIYRVLAEANVPLQPHGGPRKSQKNAA